MEDYFCETFLQNNPDILCLARQELQSQTVDTEKQDISTYCRDNKLIVIFHSVEHDSQTRGTTSSAPSFEVIIDIRQKKILKSYFVR